jgi:hypothetical protein
MVAEAINTARAAGATGTIMVRGDSAYGTRKVVRTALRAGAQFSLVLTKNASVRKAIAAIADSAWTPVRYPGAVQDPDTGEWISDAEVAEIGYTAFASTKDRVSARLIVWRVKDARYPDALFPLWVGSVERRGASSSWSFSARPAPEPDVPVIRASGSPMTAA